VAHAQSVTRELAVTVVDDDGAPVTNLTSADFVVIEDDVEREVVGVRLDTEPKQIALLVDTSQAAARAMGDFRQGAAAFVEAMHEGNEISIISFGGTPRILASPSRDPEQLAEGVDRIFSYSSTASYLLDAAVETSKGFVRRSADRPTIVVLSTLGIDYSNMDDRTALGRLVDAGVVLHTVVLSQPTASAGIGQTVGVPGPDSFLDQGGLSPFGLQNVERDRFLNAGASATGGRRRDLLLSASTEQALLRLAAQIRGQYLVEYSRPSTLIPPEDIDVNVRLDGLDARGVLVTTGDALND
jgi:VWFA-related protein